MLLADYVALFLAENKISCTFVLQGGSIFRMIDSVSNAEGLKYFCNQHEQASAMAADGYSRASTQMSCVMSTSGPGASNLLTGVASAYYDSVPMLVITGQVSSYKLKGETGVRIMDSQESDVTDIFKNVTKYSVILTDPMRIRYELEKCIFIAGQGRKGPTLIDIPDDYQRMEIDIKDLASFYDSNEYLTLNCNHSNTIEKSAIDMMLELIKESRNPLILAGWGIHVANAEEELLEFIHLTRIPIVATYGGADILPSNDPNYIGIIGMNGSFKGNVAISQSDLLIVIGARLDRHTAMGALDGFYPEKKKVLIDIDVHEIDYFNTVNHIQLGICGDAKMVLTNLIDVVRREGCSDKTWRTDVSEWKSHIPHYIRNIFELLSEKTTAEDYYFLDTGSSMVWSEELLEIKKGQRLFSAFNNTPMGWSLPAAIGAAIGIEKRIISINGDGGFQMNLQELATVVRNNLHVKIIIFANEGYGMIQKTQDAYLDGKYEAANVESGLAFPDFRKVIAAYGIPTYETFEEDSETELNEKITSFLASSGYGCLIVHIDIDAKFDSFIRSDFS